MSLRAMLWAMDEAPVESATERLILIYLADYASDDGTGIFPAMQKIASRSGFSRSTVKRTVKRLADRGVLAPGDDRLVGHYREDKRPNVWNLVYAASDILAAEVQSKVTMSGADRVTLGAEMAGVQSVDSGGSLCAPVDSGGSHVNPRGGSYETERGVTAMTPKPEINHKYKPGGRAQARACVSDGSTNDAGVHGVATESAPSPEKDSTGGGATAPATEPQESANDTPGMRTGAHNSTAQYGAKALSSSTEGNTAGRGGKPPKTLSNEISNLMELVEAHKTRRNPLRCQAHQEIPEGEYGPPCRACKQAREAHEASEEQRQLDERAYRRARIDACDECDEVGQIKFDHGVAICAHEGVDSARVEEMKRQRRVRSGAHDSRKRPNPMPVEKYPKAARERACGDCGAPAGEPCLVDGEQPPAPCASRILGFIAGRS